MFGGWRSWRQGSGVIIRRGREVGMMGVGDGRGVFFQSAGMELLVDAAEVGGVDVGINLGG